MGDMIESHAPTRAGLSGRRRRLLLTVLAALLAAALLTIGWMWRHAPNPFAEYGALQQAVAKPGEAMMIGVINSPLAHRVPAVTLESATPIVTRTVRGAQVWVVTCVRAYHAQAHVGSDRALPRARCEHVHPVAGTRIPVGHGTATDIVMVIQSPRPGLVVVSGLRVRYTDGWRHGEQVIGDHVRVRYRPDTPR